MTYWSPTATTASAISTTAAALSSWNRQTCRRPPRPFDQWLAVGQTLANVVGVWDRSMLPNLPPGASRVLMLTPGGPRFGQGLDNQLRLDRGAATFLDAATELLLIVVEAAERPTGG